MKKCVLSITLLVVLVVANVHGKAGRSRYSGYSRYSRYSRGARNSEQMMKFGARVGWNASSWCVNEVFKALMLRGAHSDLELKWGLRCDLYGEYALTDSLGVHLTLMYIQKGTKISVPSIPAVHDSSSIVVKESLSYDYIALAPSLRMYPGQDRQFCIFLGPYVGYLVSAKSQVYEDAKAVGDPVDCLDEDIPEEERPNRFDFGAMFGIDYEFDSGVLLGGIYAGDIGLASVIKEDENISQESNQEIVKNSSVQAWVGYNFARLFY